MAAAHYRLGNITAIIDRNSLQISGSTEKTMRLEPLSDKWKAFGWGVCKINGHDIEQIVSAIEQAKKTIERPTVILAHTIKGKGVSFMEGRYEWHSGPVTREQYKSAISDLEGVLEHD